MNTATVSMAVTPTVISTFMSHYLNRRPLKQRPTAHLSYDEGLHLIRSFLTFAAQHTVEELQTFTSQWVPHPQWVKVDTVEIPVEKVDEAATAIQDQLGPVGIRRVGGKTWWQWRKPKIPLEAEWVEMRADRHERKESGEPGKRVMLYVHGGAYFFGSVDEHRYQLQRHSRKLKARLFAPKYRLAPQFPFPCGLQDCLAAYLYLLTVQDPTTVIFAGDSAGGGMVLSLLVVIRDRGLPLPAGAILISPWVDLTHSFPSVASECPLDYIPSHGFHHKPSTSWPPPNSDEHAMLVEQVKMHADLSQAKLGKQASVEMQQDDRDAAEGSTPPAQDVAPDLLSINLDGKEIYLKDQIQMYTTNDMLFHPLVSPIMQPTLGGLPPLLIMVGGGEFLRDEQIYLAHKCANPTEYTLDDARMDDLAKEQLARFKPTDVQLQVWDDLCHVAPTLSFTRPAKFMYRSIAQFGAWALARAQHTEIEILDDDDISVISSEIGGSRTPTREEMKSSTPEAVGKAGDELPVFKSHMIRQRVDRHGILTPLDPPTDLPACTMDPAKVGTLQEGPVRKWLEARRHLDHRFAATRAKIHKARLKEMIAGYKDFPGEKPPPSALAGRLHKDYETDPTKKKKKKGLGLALWSLWGSKHDEMTVSRKQDTDEPQRRVTTQGGAGARSVGDLQRQEQHVRDDHQTTADVAVAGAALDDTFEEEPVTSSTPRTSRQS
ncbi:Alpha/Beta hydrolase protein [Pseudomassariella vexata]|uniref:Alpha/Beta hydrolase protein n=1 Tax=Pseudomassariella vexata TaxID=1141098 RepID=A0A1Y2DQ61_9PEZI|nr:Alpha/Beta hydrolase protein [Pseudomassariella vexata]ORY61319.1 Alpha/Beta hydrolase protein [Pseudomassariella vexata]